MTVLRRMWVNQPSTLQPLRKHHGARVLVDRSEWVDGQDYLRIWFTDGDVVSMRAHRNSLSEGWPTKGETK